LNKREGKTDWLLLIIDLKILVVDTSDKNLSELVNEAIEDLIKKYGW